MKNILLKKTFLLLLSVTVVLGYVFAQNKSNAPKKAITYLNDKVTQSGDITVKDFVSLIQSPLWAKDLRDSSFFPVYSFRFTYAERALYEDQNGKPMIFTDYMFYNCKSQLDSAMLKDVKSRVKPGDTVLIEQVQFMNPKIKGSLLMPSSSLKLVLKK
ncbi:MAG TPA: hypothetical protein PKX92_11155 [Edaphocola sp.]|nr:hypothetical protein [Edaphocola sp.]